MQDIIRKEDSDVERILITQCNKMLVLKTKDHYRVFHEDLNWNSVFTELVENCEMHITTDTKFLVQVHRSAIVSDTFITVFAASHF